jgi:predicted naringenin-chalcone synthase
MNILGLGTAVPDESIDQVESARVAEQRCCDDETQRRLLNRAYRSSEIHKRHSVLLRQADGQFVYANLFPPRVSPADLGPTTQVRMDIYAREAAPLVVLAARRALDHAQVSAEEITHLISASCTGFFAPGLDYALINELRLPTRIQKAHLGFMGCHAALNALGVAHAICRSNPAAKVLVCAVELCTLHFQYGWDPEAIVANALFADGAAAAIVSAAGPAKGPRMVRAGSLLFPNSLEAMSWRIGDHGFRMTLSRRVPQLIHQYLRGWLSEWLAESDRRISDIGTWAIHPGGPRILTAAEEALQLAPSQTAASHAVLAEYGNMSSPTLLFILARLQRERASGPYVALGFGPGLVGECALFV